MSCPSFVAVVAVLSFSLPLAARPGVVVSPTSIGERVRARNPELAAARLRIGEALGRMKQAGRMKHPELELGVEHDPRWREQRIELGFTQRFPITGRLALEKKISLTEFQSAEAEVREVERRIIAEARAGAVEVLAIGLRRGLLAEQADVAEEFAGMLAAAVAKGEGARLDASQAKLEAAGLAVEVRRLAAAEIEAIGALKPLLGILPGEPLHVAGGLPEPALPAGPSDPAHRPDFQAAVLGVRAAEEGLALRRALRYDDVEAGLFAAAERSEDAPNGFDREALLGLRLKIPLPLWNRNEGAIEEGQAIKERKELETMALGRSIQLEAEAARAEMEEWAGLFDEFTRTLIPLAEAQSAAAEEAHRKGQGDLQTVFRARDKRLEIASSRLDALRGFHLARVRYEAAIGQP
ncbi:MAG: hypothetical protein EAZ65_05750 [Verrucomicrobia bacterium]|nr:MAG: hypothetical protein EAZ84_01295 [Verrucomicrobiota bacterium]TAE87818.1 MAG: hypothetical protein EAZ82_06275 [Verrucomicrobiota bacterium]TAF25561.1 MAG: hypothetical protein EAZ71_07200 [Verrucomicrobiota bacterium]TAF41372.1 MAG: hypothetical protein EAZ65_05750 [Verrucomicrobiota bacterium]